VLINKLQYGPQDPNRLGAQSNDWNRHPDDARNLTQYISNRPKWPKRLAWQTVDLSGAAVADLLQAPLLLINGSEAPQFTPQDAALFRGYIEKGGTIFVDNSCKSAAFDEGIRALVKQMYLPSEARLTKLTGRHPVFRSEFNLLDERTGEPAVELWGVDVDGRTGLIYSPNGLSCLWDKWTPVNINRPGKSVSMIDLAMHAGINIVAYATGRAIVNKLERRK
jgi:hypothetical protein